MRSYSLAPDNPAKAEPHALVHLNHHTIIAVHRITWSLAKFLNELRWMQSNELCYIPVNELADDFTHVPPQHIFEHSDLSDPVSVADYQLPPRDRISGNDDGR